MIDDRPSAKTPPPPPPSTTMATKTRRAAAATSAPATDRLFDRTRVCGVASVTKRQRAAPARMPFFAARRPGPARPRPSFHRGDGEVSAGRTE